MKILIAGKDARPNGFTYTRPDEWVKFGMECCNSMTCGCDRSFIGFDTFKATTAARVANVNVTPEEYAARLRASEDAAGWGAYLSNDEITQDATEFLRIAASFRTGDILARNGLKVSVIHRAN